MDICHHFYWHCREHRPDGQHGIEDEYSLIVDYVWPLFVN